MIDQILKRIKLFYCNITTLISKLLLGTHNLLHHQLVKMNLTGCTLDRF